VWFLLLVLLSACSTPTPTLSPVNAVATAVTATMTAATPAADTQPAPTEPLPAPASAGALLVANGAPQAQVDALTALVNELAGQSGLSVTSQGELAAGDLNPGVKVVVMAAAPSNLDQLLQAGPDTQFVVISATDVPQQAANLSVILSNPAYETFLAGYIAEVLTDRIAPLALLPSDAPNFATLEDSFLTGGRFFCGACRLLPNFENVGPVVVALPAASDAATWNASIAPAAKFGLDIVYLPAESATPETIALLASQAQRVLGNFAPPPELAGKWIATVRADAGETLRGLWPDLLAGNGGQRLTARVAVTEIAARWLTPGRQRLVTETRERLENGDITPLEEK
jgi:hypothetical protein